MLITTYTNTNCKKWGRQSYQPIYHGKEKCWKLVKQYNYAIGSWWYDDDDVIKKSFKTKKEAIIWKRIHITKTLTPNNAE